MKTFPLVVLLCSQLPGQQSPDLTPSADGRYELEVQPDGARYAVLYRSRDLIDWKPVDLCRATSSDRILRDPNQPRSNANYLVRWFPIGAPGDLDQDTRDDLAELESGASLNAATPLPIDDGDIRLETQDRFDTLAKRDNFPGAQNVKEVKFLITDIRTTPKLHFINVNRHQYHYDFAINVLNLGINYNDFTRQTYFSNSSRNFMAGSLVAHENHVSSDGKTGIYTMEFWPTDPVSFEWIELAYQLISINAPFIERLVYHAPSETQRQVVDIGRDKFEASFVHTIETEDLFANTTFQPMNQQSAFGRLIVSTGAETLSARDIVIFRNLPNDLTYVSGIITEVPQTPLSHVNLKAQQNNTPNAFIQDASTHPALAPLIGEFIYYRVTAEGFEVRAASQEEVENYFESIRPSETTFPPLDLSETEITPLPEVAFAESDSYGSKAANVAELGRLIPGRAPDGFAIPFYFYDEFMKYNGFDLEASALLSNEDFQNNPEFREQQLADFRRRIKKESGMPNWMYDALTSLQGEPSIGATPRLRSSANAEDSTGFNGAGLYDSYTHKEDEGHISKSVLQVWASLWNYRAFEEREFYRIDHLSSAMGILVHPNQKEEQANGVAVAKNIFDPNWEGYYINAQIGENLVTNPEANSTPEEMLVADLLGASRYEIQYIRYSNQIPEGTTVLTRVQVLDLVDQMRIINSHFKTLYGQRLNQNFAMEIEFKITSAGLLSIKQARPYVN